MTDWVNACTSRDVLSGGLHRDVIGIAPRAVMLGGYWRAIADAWQDGDANYPDVVSQAPLAVRSAGDGRYRIYPVIDDMARYIEIARPYTKPAAAWQPLPLGNRTRQGNRLSWTGSNVDLTVTMAGHYVGWEMPLKGGYVPPSSQFAVPMALVGLTRSGARILADGQTVMLLRPPVVYDAVNPMNVKPIGWQFGQIGGQTGVLFTLPDLTGMARPVVDPTLALQPDATAGQDTLIYSAGATANYGVRTDFQSGINAIPGGTLRGLLAFTLTAIAGTITSSTVTLQRINGNDTDARTTSLHRALTQWYEGQKDGVAPDVGQDGSTWNLRNANGSVAWAGGAGGAAGSDWTALATASTAITGDAAYTWSVLADIQAWQSGTTNYGWWVLGDESGPGTHKFFASSDAADANTRPKLTIVYGSPSGGIGRGRVAVLSRGGW